MFSNLRYISGLQESYEELQALLLTRSIQEGRTLLTGSNNLAAELEEMTQDDVSTWCMVDHDTAFLSDIYNCTAVLIKKNKKKTIIKDVYLFKV